MADTVVEQMCGLWTSMARGELYWSREQVYTSVHHALTVLAELAWESILHFDDGDES